jgi:hypothetical protein
MIDTSLIVECAERGSVRREARIEGQIVRERDFRLLANFVLDLSTTGARASSATQMLTGEEVLVSFKIPETTEWFDAEGVITRVSHGRRPLDFGPSFSVQFTRIFDEDTLPVLRKSLLRLPPVTPRRPARFERRFTEAPALFF